MVFINKNGQNDFISEDTEFFCKSISFSALKKNWLSLVHMHSVGLSSALQDPGDKICPNFTLQVSKV